MTRQHQPAIGLVIGEAFPLAVALVATLIRRPTPQPTEGGTSE